MTDKFTGTVLDALTEPAFSLNECLALIERSKNPAFLAGAIAVYALKLTAAEREELRLRSDDPAYYAGLIAVCAPNLTAAEREEFRSRQ